MSFARSGGGSSRRGLVGLIGLHLLVSSAQALDPPLFSPPRPGSASYAMPSVPLETLPPTLSQRIQAVLDKPTLTSKGRAETFNADPAMYRWLLGHPDQAVKLWRLVGAKVADISVSNGLYTYRDAQSDVRWQIAYHDNGMQAWYADGTVKPGLLLPTSSFRAWVVMEYTAGKDTRGKPAIRQQVHFLLRCDSRAMALAARILGASAPHLAEQYLGQLQMFYGGLAWYLWQDSDRARKMFQQIGLDLPVEHTP